MVSKTNIKCFYCENYLADLRGLGEKNPKLYCQNSSCPGHFKKDKCPRCTSSEKSNIQTLGIGHQHFTCGNCGHTWSSIPGQ